MSFNKKRLPVLEELIRNHKERGDEYLEQFLKADALVGPKDSADYLDEFTNRKNMLAEVIEKIQDCVLDLTTISSEKHKEEIASLLQVKEILTNKNK